jgi:chromosome segregation ATPase/CheY-like chemotaxis protein
MALKVLLAEPDEELARQQKSTLEELADLELTVKLFHASDVVDEADRFQPDLLVLRHERPGKSGFATLGMLRKNPALNRLPVLLATSDATPDAIEKHRSTAACADVYLPLPASRAELVQAVRAIVERAHTYQAFKAAPAGSAPPPTPRSVSGARLPAVVSPRSSSGRMAAVGGRSPSGASLPSVPAGGPPPAGEGSPPSREDALPRPGSAPRAATAPVTMDPTDVAFVERLFSSLGKMDGAVESSPGERPDPRVSTLRDKVRERERELQRLARLWRVREQELRSTESWARDKEAETENHVFQLQRLTEELARAQEKLTTKEQEMGASVDGLLTERVMLEKDLIEVVAAKEKEIHAAKRERQELETAAAGMKQELVNRIYEWEGAFRDLDNHLKRAMAHGVNVLGDLYDRLDEARQRLLGRQDQLEDTQRRVAYLLQRGAEERVETFDMVARADLTRRDLLQDIRSLNGIVMDLRERAKLERSDLLARLLHVEALLWEAQRDHAALALRLAVTERYLSQRLVERDEEIARLQVFFRLDHDALQEVRARLRQQELAAEQVIYNLDVDVMDARSEAGALAWKRAQEAAAHQAEIDDLQAQIARLTDDVLQRDLRIEEATTALQTITAERERLAGTAETTVRDREDLIHQLQTQMADLEARLANSNEKRAGMEKTLAAREEAVAKLTAQLESRSDLIGSLEGSSTELADQMRSLTLKLEDRERALKDRETTVATLRSDLSGAREEMERQATEINARDEQIHIKSLEIRNLEAAVERKAAQIDELDAARQALLGQIAKGDEVQDGLKGRVKELNQGLAQAQATIQKLQGEIAQLQDQNAEKDRVNADRQAALGQLEQALAEYDEDLRDNQAKQRVLEGQLESSRADAARLKGELDSLQESLAQHRELLQASAKEHAEVEEQLQLRQAEITKRDAALEDLRAQLEERKHALANAETQLDDGVREQARLEGRLKSVITELEEERRTATQHREDRDQAQRDAESARLDLEAAQRQVKRLEGDRARLQELLDATQQAQDEVGARSTEQSRALLDLQNELQKSADTLANRESALKLAEKTLREREEHARGLAKTLEQVQQALAEKTTLADDLQRIVDQGETARETSQAELNTAREEREGLQEQLFEVRDQVRQLEAATKHRDEMLEVAAQRERDLKAELAEVEQRAREDADEADGQAARLREELLQLRTERDETQARVETLTEQVRSLDNAQKDSDRARATLGGRELQQSKLLAEAKVRLAQLEKQNAELVQENAELAHTVEEQRGSLEAGVSTRSVESELRQKAQEEKQRADAALQQTRIELEAMERKAEERHHEIERLNARLEADRMSRERLEAAVEEQKELLAKVEAESESHADKAGELERVKAQLTARAAQLEKRIQGLQEQLSHSSLSRDEQVAELQARLESLTQEHQGEKGDLNRRIQELDAAKIRAEGMVRQAQDEKENLKRVAQRKLQQLQDKLKEAEANVGAAHAASKVQSEVAKEVETLREQAQKLKLERDAIRRESQTKLSALQARIDKLTRALNEAGMPLPSMIMSAETLAPAVRAVSTTSVDSGATQMVANPFVEEEPEGDIPAPRTKGPPS